MGKGARRISTPLTADSTSWGDMYPGRMVGKSAHLHAYSSRRSGGLPSVEQRRPLLAAPLSLQT
jgi:hypothetical protein